MLFGNWYICNTLIFSVVDTLLLTDVSTLPWYSLLQILFFRPMYLHWLNIRCCRCSFGSCCICNLLFFELADTFKPAYHVQLHLHLAFSITWGYSLQKFCILNLPFLYLADTPRRNFASSTCLFHSLQIHPAEILHPQSALSTPCRYSQLNFCILILFFPCFADTPHRNLASSIPKKSTIADIVAQYSLSPIYSMPCADTFLIKKLI